MKPSQKKGAFSFAILAIQSANNSLQPSPKKIASWEHPEIATYRLNWSKARFSEKLKSKVSYFSATQTKTFTPPTPPPTPPHPPPPHQPTSPSLPPPPATLSQILLLIFIKMY